MNKFEENPKNDLFEEYWESGATDSMMTSYQLAKHAYYAGWQACLMQHQPVENDGQEPLPNETNDHEE